MRKRVLVFGGTGFVGTEFVKQINTLHQQYEVALLAHRNVNYRELEHLNLYVGDLASFNLRIIDSFKPDYIVHMARIRGKGRVGRWFSARKGSKANTRIIKHLEKYHPDTHVIYLSGTLVYGDQEDKVVNESFSLMPTAFAREYSLAEAPWRMAQKDGRVKVSMLLPPWIIGDSSWFQGFYINHMIQHGNIPMFGEGENWMSLLDVEDCAGLIITALKHAIPGINYNLFTPGAQIRLEEFVMILSKFTSLPVRKYSKEEVIKEFGKTIYEAFAFSLKAGTKNPEIIDHHLFIVSQVEEIIRRNLVKGGYPLTLIDI